VGTSGDARGPITREQMVKPIDAWWTVLLVDPIATRIVPQLARRPAITPTRVTIVAHLLGIAAVAFYAADLLVAGAIAFQVRFVADCIDGKLARVTGRTSRFGQLLDSLGDEVLVVACVAALGWRDAPVAVAVFAAAYPLHFHLLETRRGLAAARADGAEVPPRGGRWAAALAQHRLYPIPTSVDVEHVVLVVGPLLSALGLDVVEALVWVGAAYFALQCLRYGVTVLRSAATLDRASGSA
jgi:phosphatidylglycerophosphate synthase